MRLLELFYTDTHTAKFKCPECGEIWDLKNDGVKWDFKTNPNCKHFDAVIYSDRIDIGITPEIAKETARMAPVFVEALMHGEFINNAIEKLLKNSTLIHAKFDGYIVTDEDGIRSAIYDAVLDLIRKAEAK